MFPLLLLLVLGPRSESKAQTPFAGFEQLFTTPRSYTVQFTDHPPVVDGDIEDEAWQAAAWSEKFTDIEGSKKPAPALDTRVKMLWNDSCLFIAAQLQEPHVWANIRKHDAVVFHDNDFEVFIDPDNNTHQYYEIEVNALNTIFDLFMNKPYRNGSGAMIAWNVDRLQSAVQVQGTLNDPADTDKGWTVEMAIPFRAISIGNDTKVPREGSLWRINFSRVEWDTDIADGAYRKTKDEKGKTLAEHNWVWSPQGVINMHYPERWGYLQFTRSKAGSAAIAIALPYAEKQKRYLWLLYYQQKKYYAQHGRYATALAALGFKKGDVLIDEKQNHLQLEAGKHQFMASIQCPGSAVWAINQDGLIQVLQEAP